MKESVNLKVDDGLRSVYMNDVEAHYSVFAPDELKEGKEIRGKTSSLSSFSASLSSSLSSSSSSSSNERLSPLYQNLSKGNSSKGNLSKGKLQNEKLLNEKSIQSNESKVEWMPNDQSDICLVCYKLFTLRRRRHHCRVCGNLVCGECSKDKTNPKKSIHKPRRTCISCAMALQMIADLDTTQQNKSSLMGSEYTSEEHNPVEELRMVMEAKSNRSHIKSVTSCFYVIDCIWLQKWLNFVKVDDACVNRLYQADHQFDPKVVESPGPITNFSLVDFVNGDLLPKAALVRSSDGVGDYRLIHREVWEVLYQLYGGGPIITLDARETDRMSDTRQWVITMPTPPSPQNKNNRLNKKQNYKKTDNQETKKQSRNQEQKIPPLDYPIQNKSRTTRNNENTNHTTSKTQRSRTPPNDAVSAFISAMRESRKQAESQLQNWSP